PPPEHASATELTAASQHLAEAQVVGGSARQPAATGEERRLAQVRTALGIVDEADRLVGLALIVRGEPRLLFGRHPERCVAHPQRVEDVLLKVVVEALPGQRL